METEVIFTIICYVLAIGGCMLTGEVDER